MDKAQLIVIGEDVIDTRKTQIRLENLGYRVPAAGHSSAEAVHRMIETGPDLAVVLCGPGEEFDGIEFGRQLYLQQRIPVLYLAQQASADTIERLKESGAYAFLLEPVPDAVLGANIELALNRHRAERALRESEEFLRQLSENIEDALWLYDHGQNRMLYVNPAYEEVTGQPAEALQQQPCSWQNVIETADWHRVSLALEKHLSLEQPLNEEYRVVLPDGSVRWNWTRAFWIRNPAGEVTRTAAIIQNITGRKEAENYLVHKTLHDGLTGLPNRNLFMNRLEQAIERIKRRRENLCAVLFLDLDGFKAINDRFGHETGDQFLIALARRFESCLRPADTVARFGGDEFAVLVEDVHDAGEAEAIAERIQNALRAPVEIGGTALSTSASIGIAIAWPGVTLPDEMIRNADIAMYRAKTRGKARHEIY